MPSTKHWRSEAERELHWEERLVAMRASAALAKTKSAAQIAGQQNALKRLK
jgi:hypothetical protein